jgi:hypothetical protein
LPVYAIVAALLLSAEICAVAATGHRPAGLGWVFLFLLLFVWRARRAGPLDWEPVLGRALRLAACFAVLTGMWFAVIPGLGIPAPGAVVLTDLIFATAVGWLVGGLRGLSAQARARNGEEDYRV